jgi:SAM-dependent methyltransferase
MMHRHCRFCGAAAPAEVLDLGAQPLANSYLAPEKLDQAEPHFPLPLLFCPACGLLQTIDAASSDAIFSEYLYFSSYSTSWVEHARRYVEDITSRLGMHSGSRVVEIASNDGYLLQFFVAAGIPCLGIEPAANVAEAARAKGVDSLVAFFGKDTAASIAAERGSADLIIGNNVFAHVPDINDFVAGLKLLLAPGGTITLEFPYAVRMIEDVQFDTIYHEHFSYYTLLAASRIMQAHGLTIHDVEQLPTHGGSLRIHAGHAGAHEVAKSVTDMLRAETESGYGTLARYLGFAEDTRRVKRDLLDFLIQARRSGKSVVGYGAPAKGNTLLNYCGIRTDLLDYTVDLSPHKQGHFLPGTRIPIAAPSRIAETRPDYVLILPWNLKAEIMSQMSHIRDWGGRFVVAVPRLEVLA